jgi:25S rRNA (cytosine2870-C5)-methyltransferase
VSQLSTNQKHHLTRYVLNFVSADIPMRIILPANEPIPNMRRSSRPDEAKENDSTSSEEEDEEDSESEDPSEDEEDDNDEDNDAVDDGFTDDNADWLKLKKKKQQLLDDDDEEEEEENGEDEDDDLLEIERDSRQVDQEMEEEEEDAAEELRRTIQDHTSIYHLPTTEELERMIHSVDRVVPPSELKSHIDSILEVLADFNSRRETGRSRQEYIHALTLFVAELYGYLPELVEYFMTMFAPAECIEFLKASDQPRPLVIRTNTIKARRKDLAAALIKRGVSLDPLSSWSKVGLKIIESPVPVGATPEYLSGHYMLQSAASLCPVLALNPQPKEMILDMSAAPGGKTSYIAQLMRNTGTIVANDIKPERQKATIANLHRLGVKNVITCSYDGRHFGSKVFSPNRFDRILLDAPCSGLGVISRDPSVKVQRTIADIKQCAHLQKELLLAAIDALKYKNATTSTSESGGGVDNSACCMVYSTCSVSVYENEEVIQYALSKRDIQIIDTGLNFGSEGFTRYQHKRFHPSMKLAKRFYPHTLNMDGFFVCKIKKLSHCHKDSNKTDTVKQDDDIPTEDAAGDTIASSSTAKRSAGVGHPIGVSQPRISTLSTAPSGLVPPPKKKKVNAKVTQPRRPKASRTTVDHV